jgi:murein DD-endopeptidase MepM/ murein hydrolase activator NlpD
MTLLSWLRQICVLIAISGSGLIAVSGGGEAPRTDADYQAPLPQPIRVLVPFTAPPTPYAAGHRGVDVAAATGTVVQSAAAGKVRFAGSVAGRGVVVIQHGSGISTEYEPLTPTVRAGAPVARGQPIGRVSGAHAACAPARCLHWGARRGSTYFDPLSLLSPLGVVRLLPTGQP